MPTARGEEEDRVFGLELGADDFMSISANQFKKAVFEERIKKIDEAISNGTLTKDQGEAIKNRIQLNSANCTPGQAKGIKGGCGMGTGRRGACTNFNNNSK